MSKQTNPTVIQFFAPVIDVTINQLIANFNQKMAQGQRDFILLISTPGGSVLHGLSAYNFLKGSPANITTHNFGSVDSIGVVLFSAGNQRLCVPQARYLLHGVSTQFPNGASLEEKQLDERLKGLRSDVENISKVVAENSNKSVEEVVEAMLDRTTLNADEAKEWELVTEVRQELYPEGSEVIQILHNQSQKR